MIEPPVCLAMVLCNHAIRDARGVYTLVDLMREFTHERFPVTYSNFSMYAEVTGVRGKADFDVELTGPSGEALRCGSLSVDARGPLDIIALCVELRNVEFGGPGEYVIALSTEGHPLQERRLRLCEARRA